MYNLILKPYVGYSIRI